MKLVAKLMDYKMDVELFWFTRIKCRYTRKLISWLQPGAERFYCKNGKLLVVLSPKHYRCNFCFGVAVRNEEHDRYMCLKCCIWLEDKCSDTYCQSGHYCHYCEFYENLPENILPKNVW